MIILLKNILKRKQKFNDKYDDDSFSIHNLMKPNTPTTLQPPKMMKKCIPREFIDIATNTDRIATETRETQEKLYNDANQPLNVTFEAFTVKENQDNMFNIMIQNFWRNTYKRNEPTRTQATQTLKNQRDAMVSAFTTMLDNNKPPEPPPKKPPEDKDSSDEEEKKLKLTKLIEIMLHNGATTADILLNLSHSAIATSINIADLVNQITAGNAQSSSSNASNEVISVHRPPAITVNSSSSESPTEIPAPTEDEEEEEEQHKGNIEKLKSK